MFICNRKKISFVLDCIPISNSFSGLLFSKFRFGWEVSIHIIPQKRSDNPNLRTFVLVAEKQTSVLPSQITPSFKPFSLDSKATQVLILKTVA